jgi:thiopurine S-methyltransferase
MHTEFWLERWHKQEIGFHQNQINAYLEKYWDKIRHQYAGSQVFVPLCGKSRDMLWLREQGHEVLGIELSEIAVQDFFTENQLDYHQADQQRFKPYQSNNINLLCGDFFSLQKEDLEESHLVYDRASLVALPPEMRREYVQHLIKVLPDNVTILLVIMEYPQSEMNGPPFSVAESEVNELYQADFNIEKLATFDIYQENPRFRERGLSSLLEKVFRVTRKNE